MKNLSKDTILLYVNNKEQLKKQIQQVELQIKKLGLSYSNNEVCEDLYNSLILKKAILKKDLQNLDKNKFLDKLKKIMPKREKLICDYFN